MKILPYWWEWVDFFVVMLILTIGLLAGICIYRGVQIDALNQKFEIYSALHSHGADGVVADGLYYNSTICIYAKNMEYAEYIETANHEWLHHHDKNCHFISTGGCK